LKNFNKILSIFILATLCSCNVYNINYNRSKILIKYSSDFNILVDNENRELKHLYLDKDNIEIVTVNRKTKTVKILQKKTVEFYKLSIINLDSIIDTRRVCVIDENCWNKRKIDFIVLDGLPVKKEDAEEMMFDANCIKDFRIFKGNELKENTIFRTDRDYLVISTK
jgi:hypothetical protein